MGYEVFSVTIGTALRAYSSPLARVFDPIMAEAMAIWCSLKEAIVGGFSTVVIQSDCEAVVKLIKTRMFPATEVGLIISYIVSLFGCFLWCEMMFILRGCNCLAHKLAKKALLLNLDVCSNSCFHLELHH